MFLLLLATTELLLVLQTMPVDRKRPAEYRSMRRSFSYFHCNLSVHRYSSCV